MSYNTTPKGAILKQVRESKGISLESVHEATKIPMDALRAIEEGYTVRTLTEFYYRGFLKMYAQYLGVDVKDVIEDYHEEELPEPIQKKVKVGLPGLAEGVDVQGFIEKHFTKERKQQILQILGVIVALFILFKVVGFIKGLFTPRTTRTQVASVEKEKQSSKKEKKKKKKSKKKAKKKKQPRQIQRAPAVSSAPKKPPKLTTTEALKAVSLTVRAKTNSWLQVRIDGVVVFQSTLKKGEVETWSANEKIELSGKNINHLEFELNGKMIGSLGRADRRARKLIVTKEGLAVVK